MKLVRFRLTGRRLNSLTVASLFLVVSFVAAACATDDPEVDPEAPEALELEEIDTSRPPSENVLLGGSPYTGTPEGEPVKILLVADEAGILGGFGPAGIMGAELMVELANENGGIMGRPVELIVRDDRAEVEVATRETLSVLRTEDIDFILGSNVSPSLLAQGGIAADFDVPIIACCGGDIQFVTSGEAAEAHIMQGMISATSQTDGCGFANFAAEEHPEWTRFALFNTAFVFGRDLAADFTRCISEFNPEAEIVAEQETDFGTENYLPFITALLASEPDFIFTSIIGPDFVRLIDQYDGAGGTVPIASFVTLDDARAIGNDLPDDFDIYAYTRALLSELPEESQPFIEAFEEMHGELPADNAVVQMGAFLAYKTAVERAGTLESLAVMESYRCLTYYEPRGWISIRTLNGQGDVPEYFGRLTPDEDLGFPRLDPDDRMEILSNEVWHTDDELRELVPEHAQRSEADC